ncbi:hypothetical protein [Streptomyces sp. CB03238]|uniref:hypothetical protein n=1 Tax=Streptomyces sp. CB03238 TaxID=1907777 RepID=UPI000A11F046|nr:hypothetical protein [Streptomyces sp. CB03238]ORT58199.1 hypothetical protein BKD26_20055 [Streptomyces sp. CB03238]
MRVIPFEVLKAELAQDLNAGRADNDLFVKVGQVGRSSDVLEMEQLESAERLAAVEPLMPLLAVYGALTTDVLFGGILDTSDLEDDPAEHSAFRTDYQAILTASVIAVMANLMDKGLIQSGVV